MPVKSGASLERRQRQFRAIRQPCPIRDGVAAERWAGGIVLSPAVPEGQVQVRLLGPVDVVVGGSARPVHGTRRKSVLAVLALRAGDVVSTEHLVDVVWGGTPPQTAAATLQNHLSYLRGLLGARSAIVARPPGYLLAIGPDATDVAVAERLIRQGEQTVDPAERVDRLRAAVALWRGQPLADVAGHQWLDQHAERLANLRLVALHAVFDARLDLGEHDKLLPELGQLADENPYDEQFCGQLMRALYRAGRQADALARYQALRRSLGTDLGIDPSPALRDLETRILQHDAALGVPPPASHAAVDAPEAPVPAQLPPAVHGFAGRERELDHLDASAGGPPDRGVVVISGTAGVGKTALAVHWAHRIRDRFPDGQLYVDLRGYDPGPPVPPEQALGQFLRALGVAAERVPVDTAEAAALYRSHVAGRCLLVVLDNAADSEQVRPLLPGGPRCLVVVTSRDRLGGLVARDGAALLSLDVLTAADAYSVLVGILDEQRVRAHGAELAQLCGYLPLALRIAAANLMIRPLRIGAYVTELREGNRLAGLEVSGEDRAAVRSAFDLSYSSLEPGERRMFRLLGLVPGPDVGLAAAAALAGLGRAGTQRLLARLVARHLVEERATDRYGCHDLLRLYARSLAEAEDGPQAGLERLCQFYLRTAGAAAGLIHGEYVRVPAPPLAGPAAATPYTEPAFSDRAQALRWLDAERENLAALVHHCARHGPRAPAWQLADTLRGYFFVRGFAADWLAVAADGLRAAEADANPAAEAAGHLSLGVAYNVRGAPDLAIAHLTAALARAEDAGWLDGQAAALNNLGTVYERTGRPRQAAEHLTRAVALFDRTGRVGTQAVALDNLGMVRRHLGDLDAAAALHTRAMARYDQAGLPHGRATGLTLLAEVYRCQGRFAKALRYHREGYALKQQAGSRNREALSLCGLADVYRATGRHDHALRLANQALVLAVELADHRTQARARISLGNTYDRLGQHPNAAAEHRAALRVARQSDNLLDQAAALIGLARAQIGLHRTGQALVTVERAVRITHRTGLRLLLVDALTVLAAVHAIDGRPRKAVATARAALAIRRRTGYRLEHPPSPVLTQVDASTRRDDPGPTGRRNPRRFQARSSPG